MAIICRPYSTVGVKGQARSCSAFRNATHLGLVCLQIPRLCPAAKLLNGIEVRSGVHFVEWGYCRSNQQSSICHCMKQTILCTCGMINYAVSSYSHWYGYQLRAQRASSLILGFRRNGDQRFFPYGVRGRDVKVTACLCVVPGSRRRGARCAPRIFLGVADSLRLYI
jgi:hypothetical protein